MISRTSNNIKYSIIIIYTSLLLLPTLFSTVVLHISAIIQLNQSINNNSHTQWFPYYHREILSELKFSENALHRKCSKKFGHDWLAEICCHPPSWKYVHHHLPEILSAFTNYATPTPSPTVKCVLQPLECVLQALECVLQAWNAFYSPWDAFCSPLECVLQPTLYLQPWRCVLRAPLNTFY